MFWNSRNAGPLQHPKVMLMHGLNRKSTSSIPLIFIKFTSIIANLLRCIEIFRKLTLLRNNPTSRCSISLSLAENCWRFGRLTKVSSFSSLILFPSKSITSKLSTYLKTHNGILSMLFSGRWSFTNRFKFLKSRNSKKRKFVFVISSVFKFGKMKPSRFGMYSAASLNT